MDPSIISSNSSSDSDDQRLQFHLQLMGRLPSRTMATPIEPALHVPLQHQSTTLGCSFIDPLDSLTSDPSPYHHAMLTLPPPISLSPSSRSSIHSITSVPPLPFSSPSSSLSSRHSTSGQASVYTTPFLIPPRPLSAQSVSSFDPDYEAERVRLAKLEQRRSMGLGVARSPLKSSRTSSASSIASARSFRSARSKPPLSASVYRPSPLRSTSTPDLGVMENETDKKKHRREMKEEYEKMRAARIEEEKRLQQRSRDKSSSHDLHQTWFSSRFKRNTTLKPRTLQSSGADGLNERRSTSQSSATDSTAQSYSALDDRSPSVGTVPTSEEGAFQVIGQSPQSKDSQESISGQLNSFDSPVIDPFRKSVLPGQVPPTPTKLNILSSQTPKSMRIFTPGRNNLNKLNRLFDNLKFGGGNHHHDNLDHHKRKTQISVVESNTPAPLDQPGWLDSIKSMRSKSRSSRRRTLVDMFLPEKDLPPPVPKLPEHLTSS